MFKTGGDGLNLKLLGETIALATDVSKAFLDLGLNLLAVQINSFCRSGLPSTGKLYFTDLSLFSCLVQYLFVLYRY